jgi:hypothetical protein
MDLNVAQEIVSTLTENDIDAKVYEGYSGRGMYGRETVAVELLSSRDYGIACGAAPELADYRRDSLGHGLVVY